VTCISGCATCKYSFRDTTVPPEIKTFRVNYFENTATYVNPLLGTQLTERLKQKIIGTTRLRQTNDDDAHYDISGKITAYYTSTTGITGANANTNRLTVSFHLIFKNNLALTEDKKTVESDVTANVDYDARLSLAEVENSAKFTDLVNNVVGEIFNKIFSNW
jgi:hypothetical protein